MDNAIPTTPEAWAAALQQTQKDMMSRWSEMNAAWMKSLSGVMPGTGAGSAAAAPGMTMPGADMSKQLLGQFENYLGVTRSLWELLGKCASVTDAAQRQRIFTDGLGSLQQQFTGMFAPMMSPMLSPMMGSMGGAASAFSNPFAGVATVNPADWMQQLPALGLTREHQESWQKLIGLTTRCAQAQGKLATVWNDIVAAGLKELGSKLAPRLQAGSMPGSMKDLYNEWIESAESAYARAAHGAAYMQAQAELSNAMSEWRVAQREAYEHWARQFDLPTRAELNSLHQQVKQLTDALRKLGG